MYRTARRGARWASMIVYGANTEIGKTVVSCGVLRAAERADVMSEYVKPVQTGPDTDEAWIKTNVPNWRGGCTTLYSYANPVSPHLAAREEERVVTDEALVARVLEVMKAETRDAMSDPSRVREPLQVFETAGGVLSPAPSGTPQAEVYAAGAIRSQCKAVLVGDPKLGGISATLCALESLRQRGIEPVRIVFVGGRSNAEALRELAPGLRVLALPDLPPKEVPLTEWYTRDGVDEAFDEVVRAVLPDAMFDERHVWHPYTSIARPNPTWCVERAEGRTLHLSDGRTLVDGMSSWWCAIHGYNVPELNAAAAAQVSQMSHVMFGGLRHPPAIELSRMLVDVTPRGLECVFLCDSGSVSIEAAMKMAIQYYAANGNARKKKFVTIRNGYHGDTHGAMSVCDPVNSMHTLFKGYLAEQVFIDHLHDLEATLRERHEDIAALILEPIVQGAGGMLFYPPEWLARARELCTAYDVLLIADEIATGFGRTGRLFACSHAHVTPDILCIGKALTGGYMTLAALVTTRKVAETVSGPTGTLPFMHGPTYMGNPLASAVAVASLKLLLSSPWQARVRRIEAQLRSLLAPAQAYPTVRDVRVLGAIGVVELAEPPTAPQALQKALVDEGVWVRPFGKLVYIMPAFNITDDELATLGRAICAVVKNKY